MKTRDQIQETLNWNKQHRKMLEGHLEEDPDVVYLEGYLDALKWVLEENHEQSNNENPQEGKPSPDSAL